MSDFLMFISQQWILVSVLLTLIFLFFLGENKRGGATISAHQLTNLVNQQDALVLDIRDTKEFKEGHITDAINMPHAKLNSQLDQLEQYKERPIVIVDKIGQHSGTAGNILRQAGFNIQRLDGGVTEWKNNNLPLIKS